jgi:hypothetical protein
VKLFFAGTAGEFNLETSRKLLIQSKDMHYLKYYERKAFPIYYYKI